MKSADRPTILIVDDERNTREGLGRALAPKARVLLAENGQRALELLDQHEVDVLLSDIRMPGMDGLTLVERAQTRPSQPACILLTAYGSIETAVEAMRRGAYDYLTKPVNLDRLELVLQRALDARRMASENADLRAQLDSRYGLEQLVGRSSAMETLFDFIRQAAPTRATVLIEGESGTGKELVARAIHQLSPRRSGRFVAVHCAALAQTLLESELFGHEKGAFTGAASRRAGRFEIADGGSLFLDEIGEIDPAVQVKILRVLEERCFERVGGQDPVSVDVRVITATNRDLRAMVAEGTFREDLFYRLNVVAVRIPPLRERREDIILLAEHFLKEVALENKRAVSGFTAEALEALQSHDWPGNVRELRNAVERMVVLGRGERLTARELPPELRALTGAPARGAPRPALDGLTLADAERQLILGALERGAGNRTLAARALGISRRTLHRKLNEYGAAAPEIPPAAPGHPLKTLDTPPKKRQGTGD